jgi:ABC-2 type transport system ATP-binding protein
MRDEVQLADRPVILVTDLTKRYKSGTHANRGISFQAGRGECVAVLGPNGAGKTTFLRQLTTELTPTSGSINILGIDAVREPLRVKRSLGVTPQDAGIFESLTVREHLRFFGKIKGLTPQESKRQVESLLDRLDLASKATERIDSLSGGQKRRLLIGLALLGGPPVLILDEPTTGLDPLSRRDVWRLLQDIVRDGTTIIFSTHYLEEAEALSDRIDIIVGGRIVKSGTLNDFRNETEDRYKLDYRAETGERVARRFKDLVELRNYLDQHRLADFQVRSVSLEDAYFSLVASDEVTADVE